VPKSYLPNYREFYEKRYFATDAHTKAGLIQLCGDTVSFTAQTIFTASDIADFSFHVEICEDFWAPIPPSSYGAMAGANILLNLSASNIVIGKAEDRAAPSPLTSSRPPVTAKAQPTSPGMAKSSLTKWARRSLKANASRATRNSSSPT
jgi:NAD+ synthase (glutamine-hydrolysing)